MTLLDAAFLSVSTTTRPKRSGEIDGENYHFISLQEFENRLKNDEFLEHAKIYGNWYGTPKQPVLEALKNGKNAILEIDIEGAKQVKEKYPDAIYFFILAPTFQEQKNRIIGRKRDPVEDMKERLSKADGEILYAHRLNIYDHFLINYSVQETTKQIIALINKDSL